jgi:hypothetical protein
MNSFREHLFLNKSVDVKTKKNKQHHHHQHQTSNINSTHERGKHRACANDVYRLGKLLAVEAPEKPDRREEDENNVEELLRKQLALVVL